jgi:hypothetical protein
MDSWARVNSVDGGHNLWDSEQTQTQRRSSHDPDKISRFE